MTLHFYQPPTQEPEITQAILKSCYLPLLLMLNQQSGFGLTFNMAGSLLLQLKDMGETEFFTLTKQLIADGKIELVNSVAYHPLMPLTQPKCVTRQIKKNAQILHDLLGVSSPVVFFPPELAVDMAILNLIPNKYVLVDQTAVDSKSIAKYQDKYLLINNRPVCELLRSYPARLAAKGVLELADHETKDLLVTVNDAELFGHHYVERLEVLQDLLASSDFTFITASQAVEKFDHQGVEVSKINDSTWQDCDKFELWNKNILQKQYLDLLQMVYKFAGDSDAFDRANSSCYLYWLSNWPWWHPGFVEKGAQNLLPLIKDSPQTQAAYDKFIEDMWAYHASGEVEKNYQKYDQVRAKTLGI